MKIGIISFHTADNYGAVLQNFSLQKSLVKIGYNADTIDYQDQHIIDSYKLEIISDSNSLAKKFVRTLKNILNYSRKRKRKIAFENFRKQYLKLSNPIFQNNINLIEDDYEIFICGGDQIWNYSCSPKVNMDIYTLNFVQNKYKASYSASAGNTEDIDEDLIRAISKLDYITVREKTLSDFLQKKLPKDIPIVCDPVFLLSKYEWESLIVNIPERKKRFLLLYYAEKESCEVAQYICRQNKLKMIYPTEKDWDTLFLRKCVYDEGPLEFVADIARAEYVVASSFHGVVFSIIFHKEFVTILDREKGERIRDLLEILGLQNRIVKDLQDFKNKENNLAKIDYDRVDKILDQWKNFSMRELNKICEKTNM